MKKLVLVLGLLIVLIGAFLFLSASKSQESVLTTTVDTTEAKWTVSGYFVQNENLSIRFSPSNDWSLPVYFPDIEEMPYVKYLWINITCDFSGNYTFMEVSLVPPIGVTPAPPYNFLLSVYAIRINHNDLLIIDDPPSDFGGIVRNNGSYTIDCSLVPASVIDTDAFTMKEYTHAASPPSQLILYKDVAEISYPYALFYSPGLATLIIGTIVTAGGALSKRRKPARQSATIKHQLQTRKS